MEFHERIEKARKDAELTQEEFAELLGKSRSAVVLWEAGKARPRQAVIEKIAEITGKPRAWLENEIGLGDETLMVVGEIAAGVWKEASVHFEPYAMPYSPRSDFPRSVQHLWVARGTSMDKIAGDGDLLHGISVDSGMITPENEDVVIVRRTEGSIAEYTVKQMIREKDRWILRPLSNDPDWQKDIELNGDESTTIEVVDVVVGIVRVLRRERRGR